MIEQPSGRSPKVESVRTKFNQRLKQREVVLVQIRLPFTRRANHPARDAKGNAIHRLVQDGPETVHNRQPYTKHVDWHAQYPTEIILHGPQRKSIALTFDDGPDKKWTPQVRQILNRNKVPGTFLCIGELVEQNPQVLKDLFRDGHIVGNHTYDHKNLTELTASEMASEILRTDDVIAQTIGVHPRFFRPPYGAMNQLVISELITLHYKVLFWDVDSLDWSGLTAEQVEANVLSHVQPGSIILMHCAGGKNGNLQDTIDALPVLIQRLKSEGYTFQTVPRLLGLPGYR